MRKPALGAIYLVNRYYDPTTAQFVSVDPDLAQTDQAYVYVTDDPVNGTDPTGLYRQIRRIAWTTVDGVYAALNQVSTGRSANVQPGMVRIQFQISARSFVQKIAMDKISASISNDSLGGAPAYDSTNPLNPTQYTAHPSVLAWPGNKISAYGVFVGQLFPFATQTITFIGHTYAPAPTQPWIETVSSNSLGGPSTELTALETTSFGSVCSVLV